MGEGQVRHLVVVGLGNPGKQYRLTRHNIGFLVAENLSCAYGLPFKAEKHFNAFAVKGGVGHQTLHILMPTTYMNESGRAVRAYLDYHKLKAESLIVIADDVALPFGFVRIREGGGTGGHNGLKSLEAYLGTTQYARVRMGVGKKPPSIPLADYVLSPFNAEEQAKLPAFVELGANVVKRLFTENIATVMNAVNTRLESKPVDLDKDQENKHESTQRTPI